MDICVDQLDDGFGGAGTKHWVGRVVFAGDDGGDLWDAGVLSLADIKGKDIEVRALRE